MLKVECLAAAYGKVQVLHGVSFEVAPGRVTALIGANGAGKSTILRCVSGLMRPTSGCITFDGREIASLAPHKIVRLGLSHVPERRQLFGPLTVMQNLQLGAYVASKGRAKKELARELEMVFSLFPILANRKQQQAGTLSGGEQQMLAIARGLLSRPRLLLLDEPSLGLAPLVMEDIYLALKQLRSNGLTILLAEQNVNLALSLADRGYVVNLGQIATGDKADVLLSSQDIKRIYFGEEHEGNDVTPAP